MPSTVHLKTGFPPSLDMLPPSASTSAPRRGLRPLRCSHTGLRWLMAAMLLASSWAAGSLMPVRAILGAGTSGPITPSEENESHSSTTLVMEAGGGMRRRVSAADSPNRRAPDPRWELAATAPRDASILRNCSEGHRLANGLMAPMLI